MTKRVLIFSPEVKDQEEITVVVKGYFLKNFGNYLSQIEIQRYSALNEPATKDQIGHWESREILAVMDRRLCSQKNRFKFIKETPYYKALKASYEMSLALCKKKNIPCVIYQGEIVKGEEEKLITKIRNLKEQIKGRLEAKLETNF